MSIRCKLVSHHKPRLGLGFLVPLENGLLLRVARCGCGWERLTGEERWRLQRIRPQSVYLLGHVWSLPFDRYLSFRAENCLSARGPCILWRVPGCQTLVGVASNEKKAVYYPGLHKGLCPQDARGISDRRYLLFLFKLASGLLRICHLKHAWSGRHIPRFNTMGRVDVWDRKHGR